MVRPVATSDHTTTKLIVRNGHGAYGRKKDDRTGENHQGQKRSSPGSIASHRRRGSHWGGSPERSGAVSTQVFMASHVAQFAVCFDFSLFPRRLAHAALES